MILDTVMKEGDGLLCFRASARMKRRNAPSAARILLLGKRGSLVLWLENLGVACAGLDYATRMFTINGGAWPGIRGCGRNGRDEVPRPRIGC